MGVALHVSLEVFQIWFTNDGCVISVMSDEATRKIPVVERPMCEKSSTDHDGTWVWGPEGPPSFGKMH